MSDNSAIMAWDAEEGYWVAYGTHNPKKAARALERWWAEAGHPLGDLPTRSEIVDEFKRAKRYWTHDYDGGEDLDLFTAPGPHRLPYLLVKVT